MNLIGELLDERLRFVKHKGQAIFVIDFSHCSGKEILLLLDHGSGNGRAARAGVVATLADFTGAQIDKQWPRGSKEVLVLDRPYVKRSAWVGTESLPHVFYENFKNFSQRIPTFKTREEAMDWLVRSELEPLGSYLPFGPSGLTHFLVRARTSWPRVAAFFTPLRGWADRSVRAQTSSQLLHFNVTGPGIGCFMASPVRLASR